MYQNLKKTENAIKHNWAMETGDHLKNEVSPKDIKSRGNFLIRRIFLFTFFTLAAMCIVDSVNAELFKNGFNCNKDVLDESFVRLPSEVSNLILGQRCVVSVFDRKGKQISGSDFTLSSDNEYIKSHGLTFWVENRAKGDPWMYLDGKLIEIDGNITIAVNKCNQTYNFPFKVRQAYTFDNNKISCNGEKKEFAVAKYNNALGKDLFVVMDINKNQLYLLEAPISIDASGVKGKDGTPGTPGTPGANGTVRSVDGGYGSDGGNGGNGGPGGDGGDITVYLPHNIQGISVNVAGGEGGRGGSGGTGGRGGKGYCRPNGEKNILKKHCDPIGRDGSAGRNGMAGSDGWRGKDGTFRKEHVDDIKKYFENVQQVNFNIDDIILK